MIMYTDGDVAAILSAIIDGNRQGHPTGAYFVMIAGGMCDRVYQQAYAYAVRTKLIKVTGQHNGVTRKGHRYIAGATVPPTAARQGRTDFSATTDNFDRLSPLQAFISSGADE